MSVPISELLSPVRENLQEHERRQVRLVMPFTQALLDKPDQMDTLIQALNTRAAFEAPRYHRNGQDKILLLLYLDIR